MSRWLADTSVAVPAIMGGHLAHAVSEAAVWKRDVVLAAHSALETYSVLTRLPGDARLAPSDAAQIINEVFGRPVPLPTERTVGLVDELAVLGIAASAVYDALIAITASCDDRILLTRDRRAAATYSRLSVAHDFVF